MEPKEEWRPVIVRHHGKTFEKAVYEKYEVSDRCRIRNTKTKMVFSNKNDRITLQDGGMRKIFARYRLCLASFYPNKIPDDIDNHHCDHIDGNHYNNVLSNLQWLSNSEHVKKTHAQVNGRRKSKVEKQGKKVKIVDVRNDIYKEFIGREFNSATCAACEMGLHQGAISNSARKNCWVENYKFQYVEEPLLEGEIFTSLGDYQVSNRGRVRMKNGKITTGTDVTGSEYRVVYLKLSHKNKRRKYYVHYLVWIAFHGQKPDGKVVMHDDTKDTLDEEGRQRNWLEDLSLGTPSENTQSYYDNRTDLKRVRCVDNGEEYKSASQAAIKLKLDSSLVHKVCQKKRKTTGGFSFEYV